MAEKKKQKPMDAAAGLRQMERLVGGAATGKNNREQQAQQLVYDAWESDADAACDLLAKATQLDPTNVDAWLGLLQMSTLPPEEQVDILRQLVARGKKNLGKDFNEFKGHFWGVHETRPYMRARGMLAHLLVETGQWAEAIAEYEALLELNPNDNQGVRHELLPALLGLNRLEPARALLKKYNEAKFSTVFAWCAVLERWLSGAPAAAEKALAVARKQNPHMQVYIKGHRDLPRQLPDSYAMGSKEEAICFAEVLRSAWARHPQALVWLADDVQEQLNGQEFVQWPIAGQHVLAPRIIDGQAVWVEPSTNAVTAPIGELFAAPITLDREWI